MGIVMISCPKTQRAISTGMQVDYETFTSLQCFSVVHFVRSAA